MIKNAEVLLTARDHFGMCGKMLSGSKLAYKEKFPTHLVVFNSNVCIQEGKIWFGDIDITLSSEKLKELAKVLNKSLYVLRESDGRFHNEDSPKLDYYVCSISPNGDMKLGESVIEYYHVVNGRVLSK